MIDFSKYQSWINELAPLLGTASFETVFAKLSANLTRSEAFQLKMEVKRQAKPCIKTVDLRGKVTGKCKPFELDGRTHYLDDVATAILADRLNKFHGHFVEVIYDELHNTPNNHRVIRQNEEEQRKNEALQKIGVFGEALVQLSTSANNSAMKESLRPAAVEIQQKYIARFRPFLDYKSREYERMLYVTKLLVHFKGVEYQAVTHNISEEGLKIKLVAANDSFEVGTQLAIEFSQLNTEFTFDGSVMIYYQVVYKQMENDEPLYGLKLSNDSSHTPFKEIVKNLITGNKFRYKISSSNVEEAILQRAYEFQTVATTTQLPVFYERTATQLDLLYTLSNSKTQPIVDFFNLGPVSSLESIFTAERLRPLLGEKEKISDCYLYAFKHHSKLGVNLFAAFDFELAADKTLQAMFFYYAQLQHNFSQFILRFRDVDSSLYNIPSILHDNISKEVRQRNKPISPRSESKVKRINGMLTLTDVSASDWSAWPKIVGDYNALRQFQVVSADNRHLQVIPREFIDKRFETRYLIRTKASITVNEKETPAYTCDFSFKGLQLECEQPIQAKKDDVVAVNLIKMQQMTKIFKLHRLAYKICFISKDGKRVHLMVVEDRQGQHIGRLFFKELVKANKDKLKTDDVGEIQEISSAITNLLIRYQMQSVAFLAMNGDRLGISMMLSNNPRHPMFNYCQILRDPEVGYCIDMSNIVTERKLGLIQDKIKNRPDKTFVDIIIIDRGNKELAIKMDEEFDDVAELRLFLQSATEANFNIFVVRVLASALFRFNPEVFRLELKYVNHYAPHRADLILKQINQIKGVCHLFEVTPLFLTRLGLSYSRD